MARELSPFLIADRLYFESLGRLEIDDRLREITESSLPTDWKLRRDDVWLKTQIAPGGTAEAVSNQGFKIHISVIPDQAEELLRIAVPICVDEGLRFKHAADRALLVFMSSKNFGRSSSGKFFVTYPNTVAQLERVLKRLDGATRHMRGAYVLSDKRYCDSRVLFYRYGGFAPMFRLNADGGRVPIIIDPDGRPYDDERKPFFTLPPWVDDPFPDESEDDGDELLGGRYKVRSSLSFSNSGGVYLARDRKSGADVVIKEARPLTQLFQVRDRTFLDAVDLLHNEYNSLSKLKDLACVVSPIEIFKEWEHTFLVEDHVPGLPLMNYRAKDDFHLFPYVRDADRLGEFAKRFRAIAIGLIDAVTAIHERGVVLADISPANIFVDPSTLEICFIDLESSIREDSDEGYRRLASLWLTPGFRDQHDSPSDVAESDDFFGLGTTLESLFVPNATMHALDPAAVRRTTEKIRASVDLPLEVMRAIDALKNSDAPGARRTLEAWDVEASIRAVVEDPSPEPVWRPTDQDLESAIERLADHIVSTTSPERADRLWPGDYLQFAIGPDCLGYGACGVALFLLRARGTIPKVAREWLVDREVDPRVHAPGLFTGMAGMAYAYQHLGLVDKALDILEASNRSPLIAAEPGFFQGAAGWGWTHLYFHRVHGVDTFLQRAIGVGESLLRSSSSSDEGRSWIDPRKKKVSYGLGYGASGIALFLLELSRATDDERFLEAGAEALRFDASRAIERPSGGLGWVRFEGDTSTMPYWRYGSAGVGSVAIRYYRARGAREHLELARKAAREAFNRFTAFIDQFDGLAGIGEFMIDMYLATGETPYLDMAFDLADSILRYRVERPEGIAFPGQLLLRLSHDFGTGGAGVGLFFERLLHPGPRLVQDLDAQCRREPATTAQPQWVGAV